MSDTEEAAVKEEGVRTHKPLPEELLTGLNLLRSNSDLFDITVIIGNKPFRAHKAVLASLSGYFQVMFTNPGFVEGNQSEIQIKEEGLIPESFDHLLDFMYTGKVNVREIQAVVDLLQIAGFLQVKGAITVCVDYLKEVALEQEISFETAFFMSSIANRLDHPDLKNIVDRYVGQSMIKFVETTEFLEQMTVEYLGELLMREDLNETSSEEEILEVVVSWLQFDWENRKSHIVALLTKIRLAVIPEHMLNEILGDEMEAIAKDILSKKEEIQSKQRGVLTTDTDAAFQVTQVHVERQGFRTAIWREVMEYKDPMSELVSTVIPIESKIYPGSLIRPPGGTYYKWNELMDGDSPSERIEFDDASHKFLTNLPEFVVSEIHKTIPQAGWRLARYSELVAYKELARSHMKWIRNLMYNCKLQDRNITGTLFHYWDDGLEPEKDEREDSSPLTHQLWVKYPPEFCLTPSGKDVPGWRHATCKDVEDNLNMIKPLLKGKKAQYVCLLKDGKVYREGIHLTIDEGMFMGLKHQVLIKLNSKMEK